MWIAIRKEMHVCIQANIQGQILAFDLFPEQEIKIEEKTFTHEHTHPHKSAFRDKITEILKIKNTDAYYTILHEKAPFQKRSKRLTCIN